VIEKQYRGNMKMKFLHKSRSKSWFKKEWKSQLAKATDATGGADIIYRMWRISLLCGSDIVDYVTK